MPSTDGIVRLAADQIEDAGEMLGRAFFDNPMSVYLLPAAATRSRPLTWMFDRTARYGHLFGEVYTTTGSVDGAAIWLPPGSPPISGERVIQAGMGPMSEEMGPDAFGRLMAVKRTWDGLRKRDAPEPHWYLWVLGVDPPRQGQGVGGALLQPVLARADAEGLPCYLETDKGRNVPFYQKHGFEVLVEGDLPDGGLHYWTLKRPPRR
jgi:GNAT superfamily N-acetyltransferase